MKYICIQLIDKMSTNINKMKIKNEILDLILSTPRYFADIFLLVNDPNKIIVKPESLQKRLERRSKTTKESLVILEYFRGLGYNDSEIFESQN